ncbi:hypothetical protein KKG31_08700 [Patescibacteria group bacterium]|nr:hypothetical protein [Patescibacteria group bacterium]MBU1759131.1 hypothetical protein [Patescibacteria group bacterium]MBU1907075.1 hypothetical protein [Patescibacteria group bacterium]
MAHVITRKCELLPKRSDHLSDFYVAMIGRSTLFNIMVRGAKGKCDCGLSSQCEQCKATERLALKILSTHDITGERQAFLFWGFVTDIRHKDMLLSTGDLRNLIYVLASQYVWGSYTPLTPDRCWISPYKHSHHEHAALLQRLDELFVPGVHTDEADGVRRINTFEELVDLVALGVPCEILYKGKHRLLGMEKDHGPICPIEIDMYGESEQRKEAKSRLAAALYGLLNNNSPNSINVDAHTDGIPRTTVWWVESPRDPREAGGPHHIHP